MALELGNLQRINIKRKLTVSGFMRKIEKTLNLQIPVGIDTICILFYGNGTDQWDSHLIPDNVAKLDEENQIVTNISGICNVYMKRIIDNGYHEWKLKVKFSGGSGNSLMIGLWRIQKDKSPPITNTHYNKGREQGYGFHCSSGELICTDKGFGVSAKYGVRVTHAIVDMIVDFNKLSLSFKIDGKDYGKAFDIKKNKYRAVIFFDHAGDFVQILENDS